MYVNNYLCVNGSDNYYPINSLPCNAFCGCIWDIYIMCLCVGVHFFFFFFEHAYIWIMYACVWGLTHNRFFIIIKWHWGFFFHKTPQILGWTKKHLDLFVFVNLMKHHISTFMLLMFMCVVSSILQNLF